MMNVNNIAMNFTLWKVVHSVFSSFVSDHYWPKVGVHHGDSDGDDEDNMMVDILLLLLLMMNI